ncbi:FecCD family ABC transporter permease [Methanocella conradii]|uniref:FecCD family ABC transporter permease n=1 Tax=Methanocella conradii TaxID=1175444 RepID=UPI0024B36662|nr:iron chelate uptake ABC transporter family permease subunit [Methanocella conradii]MDI6895717.1 iron chelate uptake ABC transporter family permease subunit [Methanocella conradii]
MDKKMLRWALIISSLTLALLVVAIVSTAVGPANISVDRVALIIISDLTSKIPLLNQVQITKTWTDGEAGIILLVRLPRVILGLLVGATLAVAGVAAQAIFKNPMADPYILGVSSGAAFGAATIITFGIYGLSLSIPLGILTVKLGAIQLGALAGGLLAAFLVFNIARTGTKLPVETVLLSGIAVSAFFSAVTSFLMYIGGHSLSQVIYWVMGALWSADWDGIWLMLPLALIGSFIIFAFSRDLNLILLGDEAATHLGTNVTVLKAGILALAAVITAAAVSVSGIIGFVGLVIPHIMRLIVGPDHRILIPSSILAGAMFLTVADTFSRMIIQPTEIPVGIITALVGAPFFVFLLSKKKKEAA